MKIDYNFGKVSLKKSLDMPVKSFTYLTQPSSGASHHTCFGRGDDH